MRIAYAILFALLFAVTAIAGPKANPGRDPGEHYFYFESWNSHDLWLESVVLGEGTPTEGDEIGVFTREGICAGAIVWSEWDEWGVTLTAYGKDMNVPNDSMPGFVEGEEFAFKLWVKATEEEFVGVPEWTWGEPVYSSWNQSQLNLSFNVIPGGGGNGENPFVFTETIDSHLILVTGVTINGAPLAAGNWIGIFTPDELCVGAGEWNEEQLGIAVWADDPETDAVDGFDLNQEMQFRIWLKDNDEVILTLATIEEGPNEFAIDGMTICSLDNNVGGQLLSITSGWSLISMNITPATDDVTEIFAPISDGNDAALLLLKNQNGEFYSPTWGFSNIEAWNSAEGYMIKVNQNVDLAVAGEPIAADKPILVEEGWQIVAYYPTVEISAVDGFASVADLMTVVKNDHGQFYFPARQFNNMDPLKPGKGYKIKMSEAADLVYLAAAPPPPPPGPKTQCTIPTHYALPDPTGADMSLLLTTDLPSGYEIAALNAAGQVVGAGVVDADGKAGLALWGVDKLSAEPTVGLADNETPRFVVWTGEAEIPANVSASKGDIVYQTDALAIGSLVESPVVTEFGLSAVYPNPFNNVTNISFNLVTENNVTLTVVDLNGRTVATLMSDSKPAGRYSLSFNAGDLASGTYLVRLDSGSQKSVRKLQLLK